MSITNEQLSIATLQLLSKINIKLLAIDFDLTFISIHTGGKWKEGPEILVQYVRPYFEVLIGKVLAESNIFVSITTYSTQHDLILYIMKIIFPYSHKRIIVQTTPPDMDIIPKSMIKAGKEKHISKVVNQLWLTREINILPGEVLLFDDDINNIKCALQAGHYAMHITTFTTLTHIVQYLEKNAQFKSIIPKNDMITAFENLPIISLSKKYDKNYSTNLMLKNNKYKYLNNNDPSIQYYNNSNYSTYNNNNFLSKSISGNSTYSNLEINTPTNQPNQEIYLTNHNITNRIKIMDIRNSSKVNTIDYNNNPCGPLLKNPIERKNIPIASQNLFNKICNNQIENNPDLRYNKSNMNLDYWNSNQIVAAQNLPQNYFQNGTIFPINSNASIYRSSALTVKGQTYI